MSMFPSQSMLSVRTTTVVRELTVNVERRDSDLTVNVVRQVNDCCVWTHLRGQESGQRLLCVNSPSRSRVRSTTAVWELTVDFERLTNDCCRWELADADLTQVVRLHYKWTAGHLHASQTRLHAIRANIKRCKDCLETCTAMHRLHMRPCHSSCRCWKHEN